MEKATILTALKSVRNTKRNFSQTIDFIVSLKDLDLKKIEHQIDLFITLPHQPGKKVKICALVGQELAPEAHAVCDTVVLQDDFARYAKDKKSMKKLARDHTYFIGQANIMPQVASTFGRVLGPRGKMPNPKAGCIVPPKAALKPLYARLQNTIRVSAKTAPVIQCRIGSESMEDEHILQNINAIYEQLIHALPGGDANIHALYLKLTMGKPVKIK